MTTLQEVLPCPFCGKQHTLQVISGQELMGEDQEFWQHSESFGVVCDASTPDGKGGCGATGGFKPTEDEAIEAWNTRTALAQQELPQKECPDFMAGYDAGMADAKRMAQHGNTITALRSQVEYLDKIVEDQAKVLAQQGEPVAYMAKNKNGGNESLIRARLLEQIGRSDDHDYTPLYAGAAPAPQAHHVPEVGFGNMPYSPYLFGGLRFKMNFDKSGNATNFHGAESALQGAWVALVDATDNCHLQSAQPVAQPAQGVGRTNPCDETGGAVERFGWQTFLGKSPEIIPATNGSFVWYSDYLKLWQSAQPVAQPKIRLSDDEILSIAHRTATRYTHFVQPGQVMYGFAQHHMIDLVRAIEAAHGIGGVK